MSRCSHADCRATGLFQPLTRTEGFGNTGTAKHNYRMLHLMNYEPLFSFHEIKLQTDAPHFIRTEKGKVLVGLQIPFTFEDRGDSRRSFLVFRGGLWRLPWQRYISRLGSRLWDLCSRKDPWIQTSSATVNLKAAISSAMASAGVLHPRVFLGRLFIRFATSFSHVWLASFRSVPLGMN